MSASEHDKIKPTPDDLKATAAKTDAAPPPAPAEPRHERDPKAPRSRVVLGTIIALAMVLLAGSFVVVVATIPAPKPKEPNQVTPAVNVSVMPIEPVRDFIDAFTTPGSVEPNSVVRVAAEVPGRIERVIGVEGRPVKAGDRLIELNTDLLQASLDQARSAMELDVRELDRVLNLQQRGSATSTELDQARSRAEVSKAAYDAARAQLDRAVIFAPTSGTLDKVPVEKGEYVTPGKVVAEIVETDPAIVAVDVPERDMRYIRVGQEETIVADALDGREFTGTVHYISAVADAASRTTRVELRRQPRRRPPLRPARHRQHAAADHPRGDHDPARVRHLPGERLPRVRRRRRQGPAARRQARPVQGQGRADHQGPVGRRPVDHPRPLLRGSRPGGQDHRHRRRDRAKHPAGGPAGHAARDPARRTIRIPGRDTAGNVLGYGRERRRRPFFGCRPEGLAVFSRGREPPDSRSLCNRAPKGQQQSYPQPWRQPSDAPSGLLCC